MIRKMRKSGKRWFTFLLVLSTLISCIAWSSEARADREDDERRRLLPDPPIENVEPPVPTQVCKTAIRNQKSNVDYYLTTAVYYGAHKHGVTEQTVVAGVHRTEMLLRDVEALGSSMGNFEIASAARNPFKYVTADVLTVIDLTPDQGKGPDGKNEATIGVSTVSPTDKILVLHYTNAGWENIMPSYVGDERVSFKSDSMSPFVVVRINVTDFPL